MSVTINGHDAIEITARAVSHDDCHWVRLTTFLRDHGELEIDVFFRGPLAAEQARIYADAITEANEKIAALQLPVEAPSIVAERCREIVEQGA